MYVEFPSVEKSSFTHSLPHRFISLFFMWLWKPKYVLFSTVTLILLFFFFSHNLSHTYFEYPFGLSLFFSRGVLPTSRRTIPGREGACPSGSCQVCRSHWTKRYGGNLTATHLLSDCKFWLYTRNNLEESSHSLWTFVKTAGVLSVSLSTARKQDSVCSVWL